MAGLASIRKNSATGTDSEGIVVVRTSQVR